MTEHVHEWILDTYRDPDEPEGLQIGMFCWHKGCNERRYRTEAEARLNATERLSAELAREIGDCLYAGIIDHERKSAVLAYADTLEGK